MSEFVWIASCFMCGDEIPTGTYCSESCRKEHEAIIEARPWQPDLTTDDGGTKESN